MKKEVEIKKEEPAFVLKAWDYNGEEDTVEVSWEELKKARSGMEWVVTTPGNSYRECRSSHSATLLFKDEAGAFIRFVEVWVGSYPNYEMEEKVEVKYFHFLA